MQACKALSLIADDEHLDNCLAEATVMGSPFKLRILFATIIAYCEVLEPIVLWNKYKKNMSTDIYYKKYENDDIELEYDKSIYNNTLSIIEDLVIELNGRRLESYEFEFDY